MVIKDRDIEGMIGVDQVMEDQVLNQVADEMVATIEEEDNIELLHKKQHQLKLQNQIEDL